MTILGILFRQKNVVIGAKGSGRTGLGGLLDEAKDTLTKTWNANTSKGIVVDATVNEEHLTTCEATENPVEEGATVTDHVHINNAQLTIEGVITDSPLGYAVIGNIQNLVKTFGTLFGGGVRSIDAYNDLLKLQRSRQPFTVITGLKRYENMVMTELSVPRTSKTGSAIHFRATMKEIKIVKSQTTDAVSQSTAVSNLASKTKDYGQKVTDAAPTGSQTAGPNSDVVSNQTKNKSILQGGYDSASDWFSGWGGQ